MAAHALRRALLIVALTCFYRAAAAQTSFPPATSRSFNIDLFEQPELGSPRLVAMSGAVNSVSEGGAGLFANPASAAVRPETKSDKFAWNIYLNSYAPTTGQDLNNNGQSVTNVRRSLLGSAGVLLQYGKWGVTLDGGFTAHEITPAGGGGLGVRSLIGHLALARSLLDDDVAVGVGVRLGGLNVYTLGEQQTLFTRAGASGEGGVVWKPREQSFRVALSGALPVYTGTVQYECDPNNCFGYVLPLDAIVPWTAAIGGAWRWGPTPWNHEVGETYRDEHQLTVALELAAIGSVSNGYGMEAFAAKQLQVSGRDTILRPRLGVESEVIRGWLRLRAGSYVEGSRFYETNARWHATGGFEVRLFAFHLGGRERRVAISAAADVASLYKNLGVSIGFWN